ncbi:SRPBCC domain-containing protein [Pseudarthrobacter phenanthrenivorans]|uniref:SRPBCC family protein n=1 Tax=Pseudarthrobacter phenanthrenivorans TaxID=361575 RepID=UPI001129DB75|nr:SRPBCC domain-containing protein [Pseudarthrobacter phenanthrenivorans]TPV50150.1 SRPBCC domain-containing protein [Pseudarthrobacter phenanthrenivorans]
MTENRNFEIVYDTELPGTPERVWEAVTTGTPGWMFPTDQWPDVKTVQEYPTHLVSRMEGPDGWFNQLEHVLEPLEGGRARLHYVHSGIFADNWDEQYDGASRHTEFYLHTLGQYLQHFDGKPVVFTDIQGPDASQAPDGFTRLRAALGLESAGQGSQVDVEVDGVGRLAGEVDFSNEHFLGVRTADAMYRFFGRNAWGAPVGMTVHDFSGAGDSETTAKAWGGFLSRVYA